MEKLEIGEMANGWHYLLLSEAVTWDGFPAFGEGILRRLQATVVTRATTADMHMWEIQVGGLDFLLVFDDHPLGVTLEPKSEEASAHLGVARDLLLGD